MPVETATDVKTAESSSNSAEGNVSSTENKDTAQTDTGVKEPESMAEVAEQVAKKHNIGVEEAETTEASETGKETVKEGEGKEDLSPDEKDTKGKVEETDKVDKETEVLEIDEANPPQHIPYARFKEVNEKAKTFEAQVKEVEPVVKHHRDIVTFCRTNGITQSQFSDGLKLMSLINKDPARAVEHLTGVIEQLQGFVGDKLPEDLQRKVDEGKIEVDDAKEIASLRAKTKYVEARTKQSAEQQQQAAESKFLREVHTATASWEQTKIKTDPDMREGSEKHQLVLDKFRALSDEKDDAGEFRHPVQTVQDYIKLLDAAYTFVDKFVSKLTKGNKQTKQKVLTSTASSVTAEVEPTSMQDIAKQVGAKHGISI